eukprot:10533479-Ditylum_brightwellii.AAC.1
MKINLRSPKETNYLSGNRLTPTPFNVAEKKTQLSPLDYKVYKLCTDQKYKKYVVYLLMVGIYEVGTLEEWLHFMSIIKHVIKDQGSADPDDVYMLVKSILGRDTLEIFQNKEVNHKEKDGPAFTVCAAAVTEHVLPIKAYKIQKKYIQSIHKPLIICPREWIS